MTKTPLIPVLAALALTVSTLPAAANSHVDENWSIIHLDRDGAEVRKRDAFESVASVEGPRNLRLEVGCNPNDRLFLRLRKVVDEDKVAKALAEAQENETPVAEAHPAAVVGEAMRPMIKVLFKGNEIYSERQDQWSFNERRAFYQGRADKALENAIAEGLRLVMEAPQQDWRAAFSLDGSKKALAAIECR